MRANLDEIAALFGVETLAGATVVPFVLSNCELHSGYPIDGVAVADLTYLDVLLRRGYLRTMVVTSRRGEEDPGNVMVFYATKGRGRGAVLPACYCDSP